MVEPVESLLKDGQLTPHAEFFAVAALRKDIIKATIGWRSVTEPEISMLIKLCYPGADDGMSVTREELFAQLIPVQNELTRRMIHLAPNLKWPDLQHVLRLFESQII